MKFYVKSNQLNVVVAGEHIKTPIDAACEAFLKYYKDDMIISPITIVSERGFDYFNHDNKEDMVLDSCNIMKQAGFKFDDER